MELTFWQQIDGSVLNAIGVVIGGIAGLIFRNALPPRVTQTIQSAIGLVTLFLAVRIAWQLGEIEIRTIPGIVIALIALAIGGAIGEAFKLDERLSAIASSIQSRTGQQNNTKFSEGLLTAFLIFCVGPVTILGSLDNGLRGDNQLLLIKTVLDTITAAALASSYGNGVVASAVPLMFLQGGISLAAGAFAQLIPDPENNPLVLIATSTGGIMLLGLGLNLLEVTKIRIAALLPALLVGPLLLWGIQQF
jgi:uncharacterized membrane protein YqgA involved in biofilm formation